jgi:hypothetical protein
MFLDNIDRFVFYPVGAISIIVAAVAIWQGSSRRSTWMWAVAALLALAFFVRTFCSFYYVSKPLFSDFSNFWTAGSYLLANKNPYDVKGFVPPFQELTTTHNPPTALPLAAILALAPKRASALAWAAVNIVICLSLGLVARRVLVAQDGGKYDVISAPMAALLTAPIIFSQGTFFAVDEGQLALLEAMSLFIALIAQGKKRPLVSAASLAIATIKTATCVPFLLLFLRRSDRRIWFFLAIFVVVLLLAAGHPTKLPEWLSSMLHSIKTSRAPGCPDDFSTANRWSCSIIGVDVLLSRLGMSDRTTVTLLTSSVVAIAGLWLAYIATQRPDIPRGTLCSLVTLYSTLFIYHRNYDLPIQILPLIYSASRIGPSRGLARWCYGWAMFAIVAAINQPAALCFYVYDLPSSWSILKAIVVPYSTYFMISALVALAWATHAEFGNRINEIRYHSRQLPTAARV